MEQVTEKPAFKLNGFLMLTVVIGVLGGSIWLFIGAVQQEAIPSILTAVGGFILSILLMAGFVPVQPNEARVLLFFGHYTGVIRESGFFWVNPFAIKKRVSMRVRNFNSEKIKVNESSGSPIEIAAVVVWKVIDSAKALFEVDHYSGFVDIQSETALRALAVRYPYEPDDESQYSLRGNPEDIAEELKKEVQARLNVAGVEVMEARLTHLAYAPEIAQAMLRRQQAQAVIAARRLIVDAAVGMVDQALTHLSEQKIVDLDEEKKAAMVNNLMVVLTGDHGPTPIINTGTLYT